MRRTTTSSTKTTNTTRSLPSDEVPSLRPTGRRRETLGDAQDAAAVSPLLRQAGVDRDRGDRTAARAHLLRVLAAGGAATVDGQAFPPADDLQLPGLHPPRAGA